jgi:hypothetical protein
MRNCGIEKNLMEKIFTDCKSIASAIGKSKKDGTGADKWNSAVSNLYHILHFVPNS